MSEQKSDAIKLLESLIEEQLKIVIKKLLLGEKEIEESSMAAGNVSGGLGEPNKKNNSIIRE